MSALDDFLGGLAADYDRRHPDPPAPTPSPEPTAYQLHEERKRRLAAEARAALLAGDAELPAVERWAIGHAAHGFGYGNSYGGNHVVVLHGLHAGRLIRRPGDALCKPAAKFWTWELIESTHMGAAVNCARCLDIAARLGVDLDHPSDPQESTR